MLKSKHAIAIVVFAVAAVAGALVCISRYGPGLSADSIAYVGIARNLLHGNGFHTFEGNPITFWPPLYPVLLALLAGVLRVDPIAVAGVLNALIFGLIVYVAGRLFQAAFEDMPLLVYIGLLSVLFAPPLLAAVTYVWSEPLFILLALCFLSAMAAYWRRPTWRHLALMAAVGALAGLQRYAGAALIAAGVLLLLLNTRQTIKQRLLRALLFGACAGLPLALWMLRNYGVDESLLGSRPAAQDSLFGNLLRACNVIAGWLLPGLSLPPVFNLLLVVLVGCVVGLVFANQAFRRAHLFSWAFAAVLIVVVYAGWMIVSASSTDIGLLDQDKRLLTPMYVPLLLVLLSLVYGGVLKLQLATSRLLPLAAVAVLSLLWFVPTAGAALALAKDKYLYGAGGYNVVEWHTSELIAYIRSGALVTCPAIYSNIPDAIYVLTGTTALMSPRTDGVGAGVKTDAAGRLPLSWPDQDVCLAWKTGFPRPYLLTPKELSSIRTVTLISALEDGEIYTIAAK